MRRWLRYLTALDCRFFGHQEVVVSSHGGSPGGLHWYIYPPMIRCLACKNSWVDPNRFGTLTWTNQITYTPSQTLTWQR